MLDFLSSTFSTHGSNTPGRTTYSSPVSLTSRITGLRKIPYVNLHVLTMVPTYKNLCLYKKGTTKIYTKFLYTVYSSVFYVSILSVCHFLDKEVEKEPTERKERERIFVSDNRERTHRKVLRYDTHRHTHRHHL